jgi:hypothetical protein
MSEEDLNHFNRTKNPIPTMQGIFKDVNGLYPAYSDQGVSAHTKLSECYSDLLVKVPEQLNPTLLNELTAIAFFEQKYKCSGLCTPGLFFYSLSI